MSTDNWPEAKREIWGNLQKEVDQLTSGSNQGGGLFAEASIALRQLMGSPQQDVGDARINVVGLVDDLHARVMRVVDIHETFLKKEIEWGEAESTRIVGK